MRHSVNRRWTFVVTASVLAACVVAATGCLPNRLSQSELDELAASPGANDAALGNDSGADSSANGCGNGKVGANEECDFSGANWCNGCDQCKRRTTWKVDGSDSIVTPVNSLAMANLLADAASGFSVEFWFKASQLPVAGESLGMVAVAGKTPGSLAFAVTLTRDQLKGANYVTCAYVPEQGDVGTAVVVQGNQAVKVGEWHHVRCAWSASERAIKLSQNGAEPTLLKVQSKPTQLFETGSSMVLGSLNSGAGKAVFKGELDEFRVMYGANASNFKSFQSRYAANSPGLAMLLHMDEADGATRLTDSSPNNLHMRQSTKQAVGYDFEKVPLVFVPEGCYGYSLAQISCTPAAQPKAPFCP